MSEKLFVASITTFLLVLAVVSFALSIGYLAGAAFGWLTLSLSSLLLAKTTLETRNPSYDHNRT